MTCFDSDFDAAVTWAAATSARSSAPSAAQIWGTQLKVPQRHRRRGFLLEQA
jgi:hypothetical protein